MIISKENERNNIVFKIFFRIISLTGKLYVTAFLEYIILE